MDAELEDTPGWSLLLPSNKSHSWLIWSEWLRKRCLWLCLWLTLRSRSGSTILVRARLGSGALGFFFFLFRCRSSWRWLTPRDCLGQLTSQSGWVEGESCWTSLKSRISSNAQPVSNTALVNMNGTIWSIFANCCEQNHDKHFPVTNFAKTYDVFDSLEHCRASHKNVEHHCKAKFFISHCLIKSLLLTYKRERTLLDGRRSVPAMPIPCTRCCMRKYTVLPSTVFCTLRLFCEVVSGFSNSHLQFQIEQLK